MLSGSWKMYMSPAGYIFRILRTLYLIRRNRLFLIQITEDPEAEK